MDVLDRHYPPSLEIVLCETLNMRAISRTGSPDLP